MGDDRIEPERLSLSVVRSLRWIIVLSVGGIIVLSAWGLGLSFGVWGDSSSEGPSATDEALSVLGNIASASVGGLVGFLTRDLVLKIEDSRRIRENAESLTVDVDEKE